MAKRRLIDLEKIKPIDFQSTEMDGLDVVRYLNTLPTVDAVPVGEIIFHHLIIDKDGIPELKLQLGERTLTLRKKDPLDVVEVVRCKDCKQLMLWCKPTDKVIGECFIRKMNSEDEQFCMVGADDFCSYGERKNNG